MSKVSTQKAKVHIINTHLFLKFMKGWSDKKKSQEMSLQQKWHW